MSYYDSGHWLARSYKDTEREEPGLRIYPFFVTVASSQDLSLVLSEPDPRLLISVFNNGFLSLNQTFPILHLSVFIAPATNLMIFLTTYIGSARASSCSSCMHTRWLAVSVGRPESPDISDDPFTCPRLLAVKLSESSPGLLTIRESRLSTPACGKSTLARLLCKQYRKLKIPAVLIDTWPAKDLNKFLLHCQVLITAAAHTFKMA
jgi:hypothetical protein